MSDLAAAIGVELLKARRSKMPLFTALGFALAPLAGGFFMIILKDPELARRAGLISAKAQITAGAADWPTYLGLLAQATAVGGILLFGLVGARVFGREYADRTLKDLLALPNPRSVIVSSKFVLVALWSVMLTAMIFLIGLAVGTLLALPQASAEIILRGGLTLLITALLTVSLVTPIVFFANAGRGYLPPVGAAMLFLIAAQVIAAAGWGEYFPWSIPALYAGLSGRPGGNLGIISYAIVILSCLAGISGTFIWWEFADQTV